MSPRRVRVVAAALGLALLLRATAVPDARADDGPAAKPVGDPWPIAGAAPTRDPAAARAAIDAADARRHALARERVAAALEGAGVVPATPETPIAGGPGRVALSPALAARGLSAAARRGKEAAARTVPDVAAVLAGAAFDGSAVAPERRVIAGPDLVIDRVFKGRFVPTSIDDRPYVLRPNRISDLRTLPPPPPKAPPGPVPARGAVSEFVVRGVRIDVDEALLRRALSAPGAPPESEPLDAFDDALLASGGGDAAAGAAVTFAAERKLALFAARGDEGGLRRVSLRAILDAAGPAPSADATVGGLTRLLGVSCDGPSRDVTLVGIVEPGAPPIPLEALGLATRAVWREGRVPGCSLDPDPANPAGPQRVRVFGVPADSRFALTMLEADYAMKKVVARAPDAPPPVEGFTDLPAALVAEGSDGPQSSRFWLTPAPPGPGDVLTAPGGAGALFEAKVRVRSEEMRAAAFGGEAGTGSATTAAGACARSLTARFDAYAALLPELRRLVALFDAVTCARVLGVLAPRHPLLDRLADLPYAKAKIPATYPGLRVSHVLGGRAIVLEGGCELDAKLSARALLDVPHPAFAAIAAGGGDGPVEGPRPAARAGDDPRVEDGLLAAGAAIAAERPVEALDLLSDLLDLAPDDPEVLSLRGIARAKAGRPDAGILDALEASRLDPSSATLAATVRHLRREAGDTTAFDGLPAPEAEVLEATYLALAAREGVARRFDAALAHAASALRARPDSSVARLLHATLLLLTGDGGGAEREAEAAASAAPDSADAQYLAALVALRRGDAPGARARFDRAVALRGEAGDLAFRALARFLGGDVAGAADDTTRALRLDPADAGVGLAMETFRAAAAFGTEAAGRIARAQLAIPLALQLAIYDGQAASARGADAEAAVAFERALLGLDAPDVPKDLLERGFVREAVEILLAKSLAASPTGDEAADAARRDRVEALLADVERRHPTWPSPWFVRGSLAQARGDLETALAAFARCRALDPSGDAALAQQMPADAASLRRMVATAELGLVLVVSARDPGGPDAASPRVREALDRLEAAFAGTSTAPAAAAIRALVVHDAPSPGSTAAGPARSPAERAAAVARRTALLASMRATSTALAADAPGSYGPPEALLRAMFHGMHVVAEAEAGSEGLAAALAPLHRLAPRVDVYASVVGAVAKARVDALMTALARTFRDLDSDPRARAADDLAITDPDGALATLEEVVRPLRTLAAQADDPVLAFVVERFLRGSLDATIERGLAERERRIDRVLEVATDPAKTATLAAAKRAVAERRAALAARAAADLPRARAAALAALRTPADARTFTTIAAAIAAGDRSANLGASGPDDARRTLEVTLLAYLRASSIPAPEGLK